MERQRWEYLKIDTDGFDKWDDLGEDGWELVTVFKDGIEREGYFKRPK